MNLQKYIDLAFGIMPPVEEWEMRNWHISFAVYKNRIVASGCNCKKTHPINLRNRKTNKSGIDYSDKKFTCSEWTTLNRIKRKTGIPFEKLTLINIRIDRKGQITIARPCNGCASLISFCGVKNVYFTTDEGIFEKWP